MSNKYDDRNRQGKALERWEQQQKMWEQLTANLAKKVGKSDPAATLPGSIHHYRMRQEESTLLDASVPPEVKSGHHAWEMNLRNYDTNATGRAGGGFRYVQFGVPYPYPLYVPVRDGVSTDPESNTLTRVIVDHVAPRHKPIAESPYYYQRQTEYKKHIKKIFSHFIPGQEGLVVVGRPPPYINSKELSDGTTEEAFQPVVFYPPPEPLPTEDKAPTPAPSDSLQRDPHARSRSSVAPSDVSALEEAKKKQAPVGPALSISSASLVAKVRPGELAQLTLCAANGGSTAIFYQWAARERDPVPGLADRPAVTFDMADVPSGVLLPGDQKLFTFSFRPTSAGSYSQTMDLNTVPAGKERILVHLQVFAVSEDDNPAITQVIERTTDEKAVATALHTMLWAPVSENRNNVLSQNDLRSTTRLLDALRRRPEADHEGMIASQRRWWDASNNTAKEALPPAACQFREAYAHQLQAAKDVRNSASLVQQQSVAPAALDPNSSAAAASVSGANGHLAAASAAAFGLNVPVGPATANENPTNASLFAAEKASIPYNEAVYGKLEKLFDHLQLYKRQCSAVKEEASRFEPRPPMQAAPADSRPKSGGALSKAQQAQLQQQYLVQQQQQQQDMEARLLKERERSGADDDGSGTPRTFRSPIQPRPSVVNDFLLTGVGLAVSTVATAKATDPQLAQVAGQEQGIGRAVRLFEGAIAVTERRKAASGSAHQPPSAKDFLSVTPPRGNSPNPNQSPTAAGQAAAAAAALFALPPAITTAPPSKWDGSIRMLLEETSGVRDNAIRNSFVNAAHILLRAAAAAARGDDDDGESPESLSLSDLIQRIAVHDSFEDASEAVDYYENTARQLAEGKVSRRLAADAKDKGKGQGAKKAAAGKGPRPGSADGRAALGGATTTLGADDSSKMPAMVDNFYAGVSNIYSDVVYRQIDARKSRYLSLIAAVCDQPVTVTHHRRMEMVRQELLAPHADVDTIAEPTKKKR